MFENLWIIIGTVFLVQTSLVFGRTIKDFSQSNQPLPNYAGYKVLRINVGNPKAAKTIEHFHDISPQMDYWASGRVPVQYSDIMVPADILDPLEKTLRKDNVSFTEIIPDVQRILDQQDGARAQNLLLHRQEEDSPISFQFDTYPKLSEVEAWINQLKATHSDLVETLEIGKTYEKRPMTVVKVSKKSDKPKPAVWIDAGIHAREWITVTTIMYFLSQLLEPQRWTNDSSIIQLNKGYLDKFDFYILPVHNPDGYEYTHTTDRLWRKTRSINPASSCVGTDANRNWGHSSFGFVSGSSTNPCSQVYHGTSKFSEIENVNVRDFLISLKDAPLISFLSIHSYSQLWLLPYGHKYDHPKDYDVLYQTGLEAINELKKVHGTQYTTGSISDLLYLASGSSLDYAYDILKVKYSYGLELRDSGSYGFLLPPDQIMPTAEETWAAYKVVLKRLSAELKS